MNQSLLVPSQFCLSDKEVSVERITDEMVSWCAETRILHADAFFVMTQTDTMANLESWVFAHRDSFVDLLLAICVNHTFVGTIGIKYAVTTRTADIGRLAIHPDRYKALRRLIRGTSSIAERATSLLAEYAFDILDAAYVRGEVKKTNHLALANARKFSHCLVEKTEDVAVDGRVTFLFDRQAFLRGKEK